MKVHVHVPQKIRFTLPIPYSFSSLVINKRFLSMIQKNSEIKFEVTDEFIYELKKFVKACKEYKGLTIVDVDTVDAKVKITL